MENPRDVVPESVMPAYPWLAENDLSYTDITKRMEVLSIVGVPYTKEQIANAVQDLKAQAIPDSDTDALIARYGEKVPLENFDGEPARITELDAMVAYLQVLGTLVDFSSYQAQSR